MWFWLFFIAVVLLAAVSKVRRSGLGQSSGNAAPVADPGDAGALVSVLAGGGLALLVLAFAAARALPERLPWPFYLLPLLGMTAFILAGHVATGGRLHVRRGFRLAGWLGVRPSQLLLLLLAPALAVLARLAAGNGLQAFHPGVATTAWVLSLLALLAGAFRRERRAAAEAVSREEWLVVLSLTLLALLLRAAGLEKLPTTLSGDEASSGLEAVRFARGEANNLLGLGWFSFPSFYFALQSSGLWLMGQSAAAIRLISAVGGSLTVFVVYWLARSLYGRAAALFAALYLLASHYHIHFSRIGLQNIWDGFFLALVLWGLWEGWQHGRRLPFLVAGLGLGLGQYFYVSMRVVPLLLLAWTGVAGLVQRERFRRRLPDLVLTAYVAFVAFLPLALLFWSQPDEFYAPIRRVTILNGWLESKMMATGAAAWQVVLGEAQATALGFVQLPLRHWYNPGAPLLLPLAAGLFLAGLAWLVYSFDLRSLLLGLPLLAQVIMGGFSQDAPASQRFALVMPVVAVAVGLPLAQVVNWLSAYWPRWKPLVVALSLAFLAVVAARDLDYYFREVYEGYVLGGHNTATATVMARYLQERPPHKVYFFGLPRMGYFSLSTVPYLAPDMVAEDVAEPLGGPVSWRLEQPTFFIFLPERLGELDYVTAAYPGGRYFQVKSPSAPDTAPLFSVYEVLPGAD